MYRKRRIAKKVEPLLLICGKSRVMMAVKTFPPKE